MPQFDISTYFSQIFWLLVCFSFLVATVTGIYLPRIFGVLNKRDQNILEHQNLAKQYQNEIEKMQKNRQKKLDEARIHGHKMVSDALEKLEQKQTQHLEKFHEEIATQLSDFEESLRFKRSKIESNIDIAANDLAKKMLEKLFHIPLAHETYKDSRVDHHD